MHIYYSPELNILITPQDFLSKMDYQFFAALAYELDWYYIGDL
jgi:hypothetical protein